MAEQLHTRIDFLGPPSRLRLASPDLERFATARAALWPDGASERHRGAPLLLRRSRDGARLGLRLDPLTPPGEYTVVLELADGARREASVSVEPRPRLRATPATLRFTGAPGTPVSARLLLDNRGNVPVAIGTTLVTGVFDNRGIETALASTYRMSDADLSLNKILENIFLRLRDAHGGLLPLHVAQGSGEIAPGERRMLVLETTLKSKLRRGHDYHGVLRIGGECRIALRVAVEGADSGTDNGSGNGSGNDNGQGGTSQ